jgi:C4-dicarboxylate transporter DctQ subunit
MAKALEAALRALDLAVAGLVGLMGALLLLICLAQVVQRDLMTSAFAWGLEASVFLLAWVTMLSAYLGVRRHALPSLGWQFPFMTGKNKKLGRRAVVLMCSLYAIVLIIGGVNLVAATRGTRFATMPFDQAWLYASVPIGGALMLLALVCELRKHPC